MPCENCERKERDRQYHMNAINRLARRIDALGETSDTVIEKALRLLSPAPERVEAERAVLVEYRRQALAELWTRLPLDTPGYHDVVAIVQDSLTAALAQVETAKEGKCE